ncbi:four helix bundle protein, partial [Candidatus Microgenomates bacterium]|nr:four helix bundle protein [Candidatus Microgenomates bacterium]
LEERTAKFGERVIGFCKQVPSNAITNPLITQLTKAATSVGANYCEADDAVSKRDFKNKIGICKKESREAKHFIRMIVTAVPKMRRSALPLWQEAKELNLIFNAIYRKIT